MIPGWLNDLGSSITSKVKDTLGFCSDPAKPFEAKQKTATRKSIEKSNPLGLMTSETNDTEEKTVPSEEDDVFTDELPEETHDTSNLALMDAILRSQCEERMMRHE